MALDGRRRLVSLVPGVWHLPAVPRWKLDERACPPAQGSPGTCAADGKFRRTARAFLMPYHDDLFAQALACFQSGDLQHTRQLLTSMLGAQPGHFDALHLLGVVSAFEGAH